MNPKWRIEDGKDTDLHLLECSDEVLLFQFFITSMLSMTMTP